MEFLIVSAICGVFFASILLFTRKRSSKQSVENLYEDALARAEKKAKENIEKIEQDLREKQKKQTELINKLNADKERFDLAQKEKLKKLELRERVLEKRELETLSEKKDTQEIKKNLLNLEKKAEEKLFQITEFSKDEAIAHLLESTKKEIDRDCAKHFECTLKEANEKVADKATQLLFSAIERFPFKQIVDSNIMLIPLPSEDMKAKLIGRDGRNIRVFENLTGVNVSFDDSTSLAIISCFDPIRRHIAHVAFDLLLLESKIHPSLIEECVQKAEASLEQSYLSFGKKAALKVGVTNLHSELLRHLGMLQFYTSLGQNVLEHSIEVSFLMGEIAAELKLDAAKARRIGLLHDIGKSQKDGLETHAKRGFRLAIEYGESEDVAYGIGSHHDEMPAKSLEGTLCKLCDGISASRKGARQEQNDRFTSKIRSLEALAKDFEGVESAFAMQQGKELRVFVLPDILDDLQSKQLARMLAQKIQSELKHIGNIQITVIRETKAIEFSS